MSCPDRLTLFVGVEEDDPAVRAHLSECEACRAIAQGERALDDALGRLRDPAPPAELLRAVMCRVEEASTLARRVRRQTAAILGGLCTVFALALFLVGPAWLVGSAAYTAHTMASARTALSAIGRSLGPQLSAVAVPLLAAQGFALLGFTLLLNRLVAARVRNSP